MDGLGGKEYVFMYSMRVMLSQLKQSLDKVMFKCFFIEKWKPMSGMKKMKELGLSNIN